VRALVLLFPHKVYVDYVEKQAHRRQEPDFSAEGLRKMLAVPSRAISFLERKGYELIAIRMVAYQTSLGASALGHLPK